MSHTTRVSGLLELRSDSGSAMDRTELRNTCLGSATAGVVSRVFCHPLDTAKARLQGPEGGSFKNTLQVLRLTAAEEGIRGLYRGFGAVIVGGTPGMCLYLTTYEASKSALDGGGRGRGEDGSRGGQETVGNFVTHFTAGMLAETVCCVVFVPVDVVKERLQIQRGGSNHGARMVAPLAYKGSFDALKTIAKSEGLRGIYKGYGATLASFGPFSALYFMLYEEAKAGSRKLYGSADRSITPAPWTREGTAVKAQERGSSAGKSNQASPSDTGADLPFWVALANAAAAGAAASWLTNPLDMAKLRLQVQRGVSSGAVTLDSVPYRGICDAMSRIYRARGIAGLFKGSGARMTFHAPSTAIAMATFEKAKEAWASALDPMGDR